MMDMSSNLLLMLMAAEVVDEDLACIGDEGGPLATYHLKLNKHAGPEDLSYERVSSQITRMCRNSGALIVKRKRCQCAFSGRIGHN